MKLIDKDALVAEIDRRKELVDDPIILDNDLIIGERNAYIRLLSFINTLEVKEVDLERELENWLGDRVGKWNGKECDNMCRYFFELGLRASNPLTWEDIACIIKITSYILTECGDKILYYTEEDFCKEALKRFKEQKGE